MLLTVCLSCLSCPFPTHLPTRMTEQDVENELLDYEEDDVVGDLSGGDILSIKKERVKGSYVSIHSSGFRDFLLKPELLRAIVDCGFEHPSEGELYKLGYYHTTEVTDLGRIH